MNARHPIQRPIARRGYTVVELLVSLTVLAIGVSGIIAMETATASSNRHAKNLAIASHIAQSWLDVLESEAGQWNALNDFGNTIWLGQIVSNNGDDDDDWFRPAYDSNLHFGPAFDLSGGPVAPTDYATSAFFCSDLRLTRLFSEAGGNGVIRAQVRVYWRRNSVAGIDAITPVTHACDVAATEVATDANYQRMFHFVYLTTAIREYRSQL